jgi:hypothetical protein
MASSSSSSFRSGRAIIRDGASMYEGQVEVAGRTVSLVGHVKKTITVRNGTVERWELGQSVDKTWINRAISIDWLSSDEPVAS